jgi:hypothetical protein
MVPLVNYVKPFSNPLNFESEASCYDNGTKFSAITVRDI